MRFGFSPFLAYFVAPSIAVGGEVLFSKFSWGDYSESGFGVGPTVGYFFNLDATRTEVKGTVYPYVQAFFTYGKSTAGSGDDTKHTITYLGGRGGIMYMLTSHWAVNTNVYYQSENYKQTEPDVPAGVDDSDSGNTLGFNVGVTAFLF